MAHAAGTHRSFRLAIHKVLLVDDEPDIRRLAKLSLEAVGKFHVTSCSSGQEALEAAQRDPPDAILMDVMMPVLDGPATLALLLADPATRDIPIVFMTATSDPEEMDRLVSLGARGVIGKPFAPLTLPGKLAELAARPRRRS